MRYAIISDIHSNLPALRVVLDRIDSIGVDKIICLGDIVGYNANPNECTQLIRDRCIASVIGNHETRACGTASARNFNPAAKKAIEWTREVLTADNLAFLGSLPLTMDLGEGTLAFHGRLGDVDTYIHSETQAKYVLEELPGSTEVAFFGHTHLPRVYGQRSGLIFDATSGKVRIELGERILVNPGSVGQPRDHDKRAAFLFYDESGRELTFERVEYPVEETAKEIISAGLPSSLAERLLVGR